MCKINSSEQDILSYKCNILNFNEHEFNYAPLANFVSTNLKTSVTARAEVVCTTHAHRYGTVLRMCSTTEIQ